MFLAFWTSELFSTQWRTMRIVREQWENNWLYCTFTFVFNKNNLADAYCVWLYCFYLFLFWGRWGQPRHSVRTWVQRTFSMEWVGSAAPRREAKLCVILSEHSGWQESILEFSCIFSAAEECSYQSFLTSSTRNLNNLTFWHLDESDCDQETIDSREREAR